MNEELIDRIRLASSPGIGPVTFRQLLQRFGTAAAALAALATTASSPALRRETSWSRPRRLPAR